MKSKTFVEPRWLAAIIFGAIFLLGGACLLLFSVIGMMSHYDEGGLGVILLGVFGVIMGVGAIGLFIFYLLPKSFSLITVYPTKIVWRCPLYRRVEMSIDDCKYVLVEDMEYNNRAMPVIRGDEIAYIYLSNEPYPKQYRHKADEIRRKKGVITFAYSDMLCKELISVLPSEKTTYLVAFYNHMQASDKVNRLKTNKSEKKKKRKN